MIKLLLEEMKNLVSFNRCTIFAFPQDIRESLDTYTDKDGL